MKLLLGVLLVADVNEIVALAELVLVGGSNSIAICVGLNILVPSEDDLIFFNGVGAVGGGSSGLTANSCFNSHYNILTLELVGGGVRALAEAEEAERIKMVEKDGLRLRDECLRAYGTLSNCAKIEYRDTYVKEYLELHPYNTVDEYLTIDGMSSKYDDRRTYAEAVVDAKKICKAVDDGLEDTKLYCENFVKQVEEGFDFNTHNYELMLSKYNLLSLTASKVDLDYRYSEVNPDTKYPKVADAYAVYLALEDRIAAIEANVAIFVPAVLAMDVAQNESVSADSPYLTANFEDLYKNYLTASSVYENGTVHEYLDPKTYVGGYDLVSALADFEVKKEYVEGRISECNTFVSIVNGAYASTYFVTVVAELERAALYLDDNKEYSLENYTGVAEAIETYDLLLVRVEKNKTDAQNYINAVNAIDINAAYTELRAKVDAAVALQADGSVTGYAGVEAADIALAKALSKVETLEGYSSTLIASIASLKDAKSLAERRALIFTANSVKDLAEDSIDGVTEAKAALEDAIEAYDSEVAALNALFGEVVSDAAVVITSAVADSGVANAAEAIDKLN